jgi:hypothetical protein
MLVRFDEGFAVVVGALGFLQEGKIHGLDMLSGNFTIACKQGCSAPEYCCGCSEEGAMAMVCYC